MAVDEQKRGELIASNEIAQLSESQIEDLRGSAQALVQQLCDPPQLEQVRSTLLAMTRLLRPLTGAEIGRFVGRDESPQEDKGAFQINLDGEAAEALDAVLTHLKVEPRALGEVSFSTAIAEALKFYADEIRGD